MHFRTGQSGRSATHSSMGASHPTTRNGKTGPQSAAVYNADSRMSEVPGIRSLSTRFRILVEVTSRQPSVTQKDVARELGITVQAVSEHMKELLAAGLVTSRGRSSYTITPSGVDWLLRHARELESYFDRISRLVRDISVTPAIADDALDAGQKATLEMRDGMLHARQWLAANPAHGVVISNTAQGRDVGITRIEGVIPLAPAEIIVATLPAIQDGGSQRADSQRLGRLAKKAGLIAASGVEAVVLLNLSGVESFARHAAVAAVIEAASAGVQCLLVCTQPELAQVSERLAESGLRFSVIDLTLHGGSAT